MHIPPKLQQVSSTHQTQITQHLYASWSLSLPFSSQGLSGLIKIPVLGWFFTQAVISSVLCCLTRAHLIRNPPLGEWSHI